MGVISHINTHEARFNPEQVFNDPEALEVEVGLTAGQKMAALERWSLDVKARLRFKETASDRDLLTRIEVAMDRITNAG